MGLWKDANNQIHDDMGGAALAMSTWPSGMIQITQVEANAILNPVKTQAQKNQETINHIAALERDYMLPRAARETLIASAIATAAGKGITEPNLYLTDLSYRKLKDFDTMIAGLRALLV